MSDVWTTVHAERAALVDDLEGLDEQRWATPSLCAAWTVHDVLAHLVHTAKTTRIGFLVGLARAGFDFDRSTARGVARERGATGAETLERFRAVVPLRATPPAPLDSRLVEAVVHGEDIRRPLGISGSYPQEAVVRSLRLQVATSTSFGGGREIVAGLRLRATDADVTIGDGAEVVGPVLPLLLAVCGRRAALAELDGAGVEILEGAAEQHGNGRSATN